MKFLPLLVHLVPMTVLNVLVILVVLLVHPTESKVKPTLVIVYAHLKLMMMVSMPLVNLVTIGVPLVHWNLMVKWPVTNVKLTEVTLLSNVLVMTHGMKYIQIVNVVLTNVLVVPLMLKTVTLVLTLPESTHLIVIVMLVLMMMVNIMLNVNHVTTDVLLVLVLPPIVVNLVLVTEYPPQLVIAQLELLNKTLLVVQLVTLNVLPVLPP
jgi:hypothetical protein